MTLQEQYQELIDAGYTPEEASAYVTPAGEPTRYAQEEIARLGGFIGDPSRPGSNVFTTAVVPSGISSYSPSPVAPPWMVQPAGQADSIPSYNPESVRDLMDAYGGTLKQPTSKLEEIQMAGIAKNRELINPNRLEDERKIAIGALEGSEQGIPQSKIDSIDSRYREAIPRFLSSVQAGGDPAELDAAILGPIRSDTKSLALAGRHREPTDPKEKELLHEAIQAKDRLINEQRNADAIQSGVDQIVPAVTNKPSLFRWYTSVTPETTIHTNAYSEKDAFKAVARVGAAKKVYNDALAQYNEYMSQKGKTPILKAGGFELRSGASTNSPLQIGRFTVIAQ